MNNPQNPLPHPGLLNKGPNAILNALQSPARNYRRILEIMSPIHSHIKEIFTSAWRAVDLHFKNPLESDEKADMLTCVMHKLTCADSQIKKLESAICEPLLERMNYEDGYNGSLCSDVLELLQTTKKNTSLVLGATSPDHKLKEACTASAWDQLHDKLNDKTTPSIEDLDRLTARIHKLTPIYYELKMAEVDAYVQVFVEPAPQEPHSPLDPLSRKKSKAKEAEDTFPTTIIAANNKSSPLPSASNDQLDRIRQAKKMLSDLTEVMYPEDTVAKKCIASGWNSLDPLMARIPASSPKDLNLYSSIMYKLAICTHHFKSAEIKLFDRFLKHNFEKPKQRHSNDELYLTPEEMKRFEDEVEKMTGIRMPSS